MRALLVRAPLWPTRQARSSSGAATPWCRALPPGLRLVAARCAASLQPVPLWTRCCRTARGNGAGRYSALPLVLFYVVYWVVAIRTNLNIGHRCVKARPGARPMKPGPARPPPSRAALRGFEWPPTRTDVRARWQPLAADVPDTVHSPRRRRGRRLGRRRGPLVARPRARLPAHCRPRRRHARVRRPRVRVVRSPPPPTHTHLPRGRPGGRTASSASAHADRSLAPIGPVRSYGPRRTVRSAAMPSLAQAWRRISSAFLTASRAGRRKV
jgi:hypothetical protein